MRSATALLFTALTLTSCATASTSEVALDLHTVDGTVMPSGVVFHPDDRVTVELDLGLYATAVTPVTEYRVTVDSPVRRERGGGAMTLVNEVVEVDPTMMVTPGESAVIRWTLIASQRMTELQGEYLITIVIEELNTSATTRFFVRPREPRPGTGTVPVLVPETAALHR